MAVVTILLLGSLSVLSVRQLQYWRNTVALFSHNIDVTPNNGPAYFTLGLGYFHAKDLGRATVSYRVAKALSPADLRVRQALGETLSLQGHWAAAESELRSLIALQPESYAAHLALSGTLNAQGRKSEALAELEEAARLNPNSTEALNNLAWELATSSDPARRDGSRAITLAQRACELTKYEKTIFIGTLGAAYAEAGRFDEAIATAQRACDLAAKHGQDEEGLLQRNRELLERYRAHQPFHENQ